MDTDENDEKISHGFKEHKIAEHVARLNERFTGDNTRLEELEHVISRGLSKFLEVGEALLEIRDSKLFRQAGHPTFEDYCSKRWRLSRVVAYRTMAAHETIVNLSPIGYKMPDNEAQTRALSGLEPEEQRAVWKQAVATAPDGKITARHISAVRVKLETEEKTSKAVRCIVEHEEKTLNAVAYIEKESKAEIKRRQQRSAWQDLWQWIREAGNLDRESAADNCPDEKLAREYITESEEAVAIIQRSQTRLKKRFKL